jgi:hypothetical protein
MTAGASNSANFSPRYLTGAVADLADVAKRVVVFGLRGEGR